MFNELSVLVISCALLGLSQGVFDANKCLSNVASYNDELLQCQCNDGFKGLGDLCCDRTSEWSICNVGGDPWLTTYDGTQFPYNWPCVSRVAVVTGISRGRRRRGAQYPDRMTVVVTIGDDGPRRFKFVGNTVQRPGDAQAYPSSQLYSARLYRIRVSDETFRIGYDSVRHIWRLSGCDIKIQFRAAQDNEAVQYNRPGVCVSVKKDSNVQPTGQVTGGDLCSASSSNFQTSLQKLPYKVLANVLENGRPFDGGANVIIGPGYRTSCSGVDTVLTESCGGDSDNIQSAASACAAIFYSAPIKLCMNLLGVKGPQIVDMFSSCLGFQCQPNNADCAAYVDNTEAVKMCLPSFCQL